MKKNKISYLLLGLGIGIIITGIIYSFFPKMKYRDLSDDMIVEKAKELGMTNIKDTINMEVLDYEEEEKGEKKEEIEEKKEVKPDEEYIDFIITEGERLSDIANNLYEAGLIDNKEEFVLFARDKKVDKKFIYGEYRINKNTSYSTMIRILTEIVK